MSSGVEELLSLPLSDELRAVRAQLSSLGRARSGPVRSSRLEVVDLGGVTRTVVGDQGDGSVTTRDIGTAAPSRPSRPSVTTTPSGVRVVWDGATADGSPWPLDLLEVQVHMAQTPGVEPAEHTRAGRLGTTAAGTSITASPGTWHIVLVAVSTSRAASAPSEEVSAVVSVTVASEDYAEAESGWRLDASGRVTLGDVQVTGSLAARHLSASSIDVAGQGLIDLLDARPLGLVAQGINAGINLQNKVEECGIAELAFTAMPGRGYRITIDGPEYATSDANTAVEFRLRYTVDGTPGVPQSPNLKSLGQEVAGPTPNGAFPGRFLSKALLWYPAVPVPTQTRLFLTFRRALGAGTVGVNTATDRRLQMFVEDIGPALPNALVPNHYENPQPGAPAAPPPPPPPAPVQSDGETFYATWGTSYAQSGAVRASGSWLWQGQNPGNAGGWGNQRSLWGFDDAYVRGRLAGATIESAVLYFKAGHTYYGAGAPALVGSHNFSSAPGTFPFGAVFERRASVNIMAGGWASVDAVGVMSEIRDGSSRGFAFGAAPNSDAGYYSYYYNAPHGDCPRVVVKWRK